MKHISYDNCEHIHSLYKQVNYWASKNEFRNAFMELEKVAEYLWDIDQQMSQDIFDYVNKCYSTYYDKTYSLSEFKSKSMALLIQIYSKSVRFYYSYADRLTKNSIIVIKMCETRNVDSYKKAMELVEDMKLISNSITVEYAKKIKELLDNYYGIYYKLKQVVEEYVGKAMKAKIIDFTKDFK